MVQLQTAIEGIEAYKNVWAELLFMIINFNSSSPLLETQRLTYQKML